MRRPIGVITCLGVRRIEALAADSGTLQAYLRAIAKFPRLAPEQERELGRRIRGLGDPDALNALVESNLRFVVFYAKRYRNLGVPFLDLIHEGNLGLIEAAKRFDPDRNSKFVTYGVWWIRQSIMHLLSDWSHVYTLPPKVGGAAARCGRLVAALQAQLEHVPTRQEIADELEISEEDVETLMRLQTDEVSLNHRVWIQGLGREDGVQLGETLPDRVDQIECGITREALALELAAALDELEPKERQIMRLRYGLHDGEMWTLQQIGTRLQVSRERIRQMEGRAMQKLRRRKNLRSYLN